MSSIMAEDVNITICVHNCINEYSKILTYPSEIIFNYLDYISVYIFIK